MRSKGFVRYMALLLLRGSSIHTPLYQHCKSVSHLQYCFVIKGAKK